MSVKTNKRENVFFRQIMNLTHNFNKNLQRCQPMQYFTWFWYCKKSIVLFISQKYFLNIYKIVFDRKLSRHSINLSVFFFTFKKNQFSPNFISRSKKSVIMKHT